MLSRSLPVAALFLAACASGTADAERAVKAELADPESATFRNVEVKSAAVCGEVNAKNVFGGYVGFRRFIYDNASKAVVIDPQQYLSDDARAIFPGAAELVMDTTAFDAKWATECN